MPSVFSYTKPQDTYTLEDFIACQSDTTICYNNLSFIDENDKIKYCIYNVVSDYIYEIIDEYCVTVILSEDDYQKYKYRPKLLCHDIYGNSELAFVIMLINDIYDQKQFTKKQLFMPTTDSMPTLTKYIYNSNKAAIATYNNKDKSNI